jgi:hypothetical protein
MAVELFFGVELEFSFASLRVGQEDPDPHDRRVVKCWKYPLFEVRNAFSEAGLPTVPPNTIAPRDLWSEGYWDGYWDVRRDYSIMSPDERYC